MNAILKKLKHAALAGMTVLAPLFAVAAGGPPASYTTTDVFTDGTGHCFNNGKPTDGVNCNIYDGKKYVWLNGGPVGETLGAGWYFFAVMSPSGQSDTNDGSDNLLSYDIAGDPYTNRRFEVVITAGVVSLNYSGNHDRNGNSIRLGLNPSIGPGPDWYETTPNSGGTYVIAICRLENEAHTQPVAPAACKYDAFKLVETPPPPPPPCDCGVRDEAGNCPPVEQCTCPCGGIWPDGCKSCEPPPNLNISKTAQGSYSQVFGWNIAKSYTGDTVRYLLSGSTTVDYTVVATKSESYSDVKVTGEITVENVGGEATTDAAVTDFLDAPLTSGNPCPVTGIGAIIAKGETVVGTYECTLTSEKPAVDVGTNNAKVTYSSRDENDNPITATSSTVAAFDWIVTTTGSDCANVTDLWAATNATTDLNGGSTICASQTFTYSRTINTPNGCVTYNNTASVVPTEGGGASDSESVTVCGPVLSGAHTIGYWQNKNGQGQIRGSDGNDGTVDGQCNSLYNYLSGFAPFADYKNALDKSCTAAATWVYNTIKAANAGGTTMNAMLKAQMLGTALSAYFTAGVSTLNVDLKKVWLTQDTSAAFGGASCMTVGDLLNFASSAPQFIPANNWYGQNKGMQGLAKNTFDAINNQKVFACVD